ncbi:MAG: cytochrome C oxidase subunit I, partial [Burkholderiales bacterium]|nr:cytochrome C oxidase subunit I [Burkholderiales bacterium]
LPESQTLAPPSVYVVDPLGNLMMRFPADADPSRMKKDIAKLLRASRVG